MSGVSVRGAAARDLDAVARIYSAGIAERVATFETQPRSAERIATWATDGQPFLVAEDELGRVVGWARAGAYSDRCVYEGVAEHAVYVDAAARGAGIGRQLLQALALDAQARGIYKLTSRVFADNAASLAVHRAAGFTQVGVQRRHGKLEGEWKDCVLVERLLGEAADRD